jgi:zinc protease
MTKRGARIIVGGDVSQAEIVERLGFIGKLPDLDVKLPAPPLARPVDKTRIYLVDLPGSAQTFVNAG